MNTKEALEKLALKLKTMNPNRKSLTALLRKVLLKSYDRIRTTINNARANRGWR